jgi:serine/threonine-protein kinase
MPDENLILQLLENVLQSGCTPEEVCADHPELLTEVKLRLRRLERVRAELDALFPESGSTGPDSGSLPRPGIILPKIPGHEVLAVLGRGGMGVVYKARNTRLNRPVAVKMLLAGAFALPRELARFRREAEVLAELGHPNVVQIYEAGDLDGLPYFTMELVEGGTLAEQLAGVPQPADRAAELVATLARAVQAAHNRGIVHRDLKPSNILLAPPQHPANPSTGGQSPVGLPGSRQADSPAWGTPKISDFGLSRHSDPAADLTRSGARVGTPSYMAPEQAAGTAGAVGPAVDIYSLGAILYEMLTGRPPFRAETPAETERQVLAEDPAGPSQLNAHVPRDLETICLKCLHKDPARRYPSAAALADDLDRFRRGETIMARRAGVLERAWKWSRRHPTRTLVGVLVIVLVIVLLAVGWWLLADRAAAARAVREDLSEAEAALERSAWPEAHPPFERARARLGTRGSAELRQRLDRVGRGLELAARLDDVQTRYVDSAGSGPDGGFDGPQADRAYEAALQEAGLGTLDDPPEEVAARIRATGIRRAIVGALDDWAAVVTDVRRLTWILAVARLADPDPNSGWRDRVRDPAVSKDATVLSELASAAPLDGQSVPLHLALAWRLGRLGGDDVGLLRRVQFAHPNDFWATFRLAMVLDRSHDPDAIGYYRAALALRPRSLAALTNIGTALNDQGRLIEEAEHRQRVILLYPDSEVAHFNLGMSYFDQGRLALAADHYRRALQLNPRYSAAQAELARVLFTQGDYDGARTSARRYLELPPERSKSPNGERLKTLAQMIIERCDLYQKQEPRLPGIVRMTDKPTGANEAMLFAELCTRRRYPTTAARLYAETFAGHPGFAADRGNRFRYLAACAAVRAGFGDGEDVPPDGPLRVGLRNMALGWLRADRDAWVVLYTRGSAEERRLAVKTFNRWLSDVALAGVRDGAGTRLSADERQGWHALWVSVTQLATGDLPTLAAAQSRATTGGWKGAAEDYTQLVELNLVDLGQSWFEVAAVQFLAGDLDGYRRTSARLLERGPGTSGVRGYHIARSCTLDPGAEKSMTRAILVAHAMQVSDLELKKNEGEFWALTERAALLHRAGRSREAVPLLERSLARNEQPGAQVVNWLWLALVHQRLGQTDEARRWLDKAAKWMDRFGKRLPGSAEVPGLDIHNWLEVLVLRREAEALLGPLHRAP